MAETPVIEELLAVVGRHDHDRIPFESELFKSQQDPLHLPIGEGDDFHGIIDLIANCAVYYEVHDQGTTFREEPIPGWRGCSRGAEHGQVVAAGAA